jgi:hypothetical protein
MIIVTEKKTPKKEAGNNSEWDITWKEALGVFKILSGNKGITFFEVGPDRPPLGGQTIRGLTTSGKDLFIYGNETGYIIFGNRVARIVRSHFESSKTEEMSLILHSGKEFQFTWTS